MVIKLVSRARPTLGRHLAVLGAAVILAAAVLTPPAAAAFSLPRISYLTPRVSPGGTVTLKATGPRGGRCSIVLTPALSLRHIKLATRRLSNGRAAWRYRLSPQASTGRWMATLQCSSGDQVRFFKVALPAVSPAQIRVVKAGFSSEPALGSGSAFLHCGVALQNISRTDARNLTVRVTFSDTQGSSIATSTTSLSLIPAGQTFYMSCLQETSVTLTVGAVQVSVKVGQSTKHTGTLPTVAGLALTPDGTGTQTLTGTLSNQSSMAVSQNATLYAVYYDSAGNFVGGDSTTTGAAVEPGASVSFSFPYVPAAATTARVSVDPCGAIDASIGICKLP